MAKGKQLYVYGMEFNRGDQTNIRFMIDPNLIVDFLAMDEETRDDFLLEWDKKKDQNNVDIRCLNVLSAMTHEFETNDKKKFFRGKPFYMMTEEEGYGFGWTKDEAMLAYTQGEQDNGAFDDGGGDW